MFFNIQHARVVPSLALSPQEEWANSMDPVLDNGCAQCSRNMDLVVPLTCALQNIYFVGPAESMQRKPQGYQRATLYPIPWNNQSWRKLASGPRGVCVGQRDFAEAERRCACLHALLLMGCCPLHANYANLICLDLRAVDQHPADRIFHTKENPRQETAHLYKPRHSLTFPVVFLCLAWDFIA